MKKKRPLVPVLAAGGALVAGYAMRRRIRAVEPAEDIYRVCTDDGANLALVHYRPSPASGFNDGAMPVLMTPGSIMNLDVYRPRTVGSIGQGLELPYPLPEWAVGDEHIERDPMKLYSLAHYLFNRGYDVWLVNYRGQGRGGTRSRGSVSANIDRFAIYDLKATVEKVFELTGLNPVYLGHSMAGTMGYFYLQGACNRSSSGLNVGSDPALAKERNAGEGPGALRGFVNLDGPLVPYVLGNGRMPFFVWWVTVLPAYVGLRWLLDRLFVPGAGLPARKAVDALWSTRPLLNPRLAAFISVAFSIKPDNISDDMLEFMFKHAFDGVHTHTMAQFIRSAECGKQYEYFRNGTMGRFRVSPPRPGVGRLHCYSDHMSLVTVPTLLLVDSTADITLPDLVDEAFALKGKHPLDERHLVPETAHLDLVCGLKAPYETYPLIGSWLERLS